MIKDNELSQLIPKAAESSSVNVKKITAPLMGLGTNRLSLVKKITVIKISTYIRSTRNSPRIVQYSYGLKIRRNR